MNYSTLKPLLEALEQKWFCQLLGVFSSVPPSHSLPSIANGYAQFFSIEPFDPPERDVPLVVAVGINYDQYLPGSLPKLDHWLHSRHPFGRSWVVDKTWPVMRRALDVALAGYLSAPSTWEANKYASSKSLLPPHWHKMRAPQDYILAMTNISPFLSQKQWTEHSSVERRDALKAWDPNQHICDLISMLGDDVDLWVVHGIGEVWPRFNRTSCIKNWILTPNLSPQNLNSGCIRKFCRPGRAFGRAIPQWPLCPT